MKYNWLNPKNYYSITKFRWNYNYFLAQISLDLIGWKPKSRRYNKFLRGCVYYATKS